MAGKSAIFLLFSVTCGAINTVVGVVMSTFRDRGL